MKKEYMWVSEATVKLLADLWDAKEKWRDSDGDLSCADYIRDVEIILDEFGYKPAKVRNEPYSRLLLK